MHERDRQTNIPRNGTIDRNRQYRRFQQCRLKIEQNDFSTELEFRISQLRYQDTLCAEIYSH